MEDISGEIRHTDSGNREIVNKEIAEKEEEISKNFSKVPFAEDKIEIRKERFFKFLKKGNLWVIAFLIIAVFLGVYIRSMPMQDHGDHPGLWDVTTNSWTLGPDLDPWLFLRTAKTFVETGSIPDNDTFRNVPLGFENSKETMVLPYMIVGTYYFFNFFGDYPIEFAGAIFPVIMFLFTIVAFFLFVREIFVKEDKESVIKANLISLISTFFMIVIPVFLSRTIAGIPEKESAGFLFMFLAFYFFLKAWKIGGIKKAGIYGILAGISTALMGLVWGGVLYIFISIALASLVAFILDKFGKKEIIMYGLWIFSSVIPLILFSERYNILGLFTSISSGFAFLILFIVLIHKTFWKTKLSKNKFFEDSKIPKNIWSLIITLGFVIVFGSFFFGPGFIIDKFNGIHQTIFKPVTGRWSLTVAENRQPDFLEWASSFGPFIKNIPVMFWMFFIGSIVLFKKMLKNIKNKDAWILTGLYFLFFAGIVFSRYSGNSIFNGENFISKFVYYATALSFISGVSYYYIQYQKMGNKGFEKINFEYLFLFSLFLLCLITARGAVRLIMVLGPIAPIFVGFLIVETADKFRKTKEENSKVFWGIILAFILITSVFTFWTFYKVIKSQAYNFIPSSYNHQWQKAMFWVREDTPTDAVFAHWWDYGYWVQSIGNRATVTDGGNAITYWNYLIGRHVLTGDNQHDALEFLYNHNATYLLIDPTDIGKYGAFSSIGSNENYDRYSWIGTFLIDDRQTREVSNQTIYIYSGGIGLDEDMIIEENGKQILLPAQNAGVGAIILTVQKGENNLITFTQPKAVIVYQGKQYYVNLRYLSIDKNFLDFKSGINATAYVFPTLITQGGSVGSNQNGAIMFISPRLMRGMLSQKYILGDPLNNFPNFKLAYSEPSPIVESLNAQGMNLPEFVYYEGVQGPIKIWEIEYTGKERMRKEYLDTDPSKYLSWNL
jgi:asparagine N-glycosylation enzyme membrane subunit Stt3